MIELEKVFSEIIARGTMAGSLCPRCGANPGRGFICLEKEVIWRFWFIRASGILRLIYCPNCGLLQARVSGILVEGKQEV